MKNLISGLASTFWLAAALMAGVVAWSQVAAVQMDGAAIGRLPAPAAALEIRQAGELQISLESGAPPPRETAFALMRAAPLSEWPLIAQAVTEASTGQPAKAEAIMAAAYQRDPRNLVAIGWLANHAGDSGRAGEALRWLDRFIAVSPRSVADTREIAAGYVADTSSQGALEALLREDRGWARGLLSELNRTSQDLPRLLELNRLAPAQQGSLLDRILRERGVEVAFLAWLSLARDESWSDLQWPVDAEFMGVDAPLPFNWRLTNDQAELIEGGGLYATFFGRGQPVLARQVVMLGQGAYHFNATMSGEAADAGGAFRWRLACLTGEVLGEAKATTLSMAKTDVGFDFTIPREGCPGQQLSLIGAPGEFPIRARSTTWSVKIEGIKP